MKKQKQGINILFPILAFWKNRNAIFYFLFLIALPLFLLSAAVRYFGYNIPYSYIIFSVFTGIAYFIMLLFAISYTVLYKLSGEIEISLKKILMLIPVISRKTALLTGIFAFAVILTTELFFFVPYILLTIFPIVSFVRLYKNNVLLKDIFQENTKYLITPAGKGLIGKTILIAAVLLLAAGIINFTLGLTFSFIHNSFVEEFLRTIKIFLRFFAFFLTFLFVNIYYVDTNFSIQNKIRVAGLNLLSEKKTERNKREKRSPRDPKDKEMNRFEEIITNRFEETNEYNRFEDTKF